jgi:hypothetical protein
MQPYLLSDKYRTWLKINPVELQMTPLVTTGIASNQRLRLRRIQKL